MGTVGGVAVAALAAGSGTGAFLSDHRSSTYRASPRPETNPHAVQCPVTWRANPRERLAAITFDDGPDPRWTPLMLDVLAAAGAHATFFEMGDAVEQHPDVTAAVANAGHEVAIHGIGHRDVTRLTAEDLTADLTRNARAIENACGQRPTLFRPPYGRIDAPALYAAALANLRVVLWSHHLPGSAGAEWWRHNVSLATPGMILLCHDGRNDPTETLLANVNHTLEGLTGAGYRMVTVSEMLNAPAA